MSIHNNVKLINNVVNRSKGIRSIEEDAYESFAKDLEGIAYKK